MLENNKRLVRRLVDEVWNQGNLDLIDEIATPGYVRHDPAWPEPVHGPEAFKEYVTTMRRACPDGRRNIEDLIAEGDKVVVRWSMNGTHQAQFLGIPPTGRPMALTGISILRMEQGRIAECWDGYDALGLMQQLGVVP